MNNNYLKFSEIYDSFCGNEKLYSSWLKFLDLVLKKNNFYPKIILDLACGTGNLSLPLSKKYSVIGLDYSKDMLNALKKKNKSIKTINADMRSFKSPFVDLVISAYDSINYLLTKDDLFNCFKCVHNSLNNNSLFVFDINSESIVLRNSRCNNNWRVYEHFYVLDNHNLKKKNLWEINFKIFEKKSNNKIVLFEESHVERAWKINELEVSLKRAGFEILSITDVNFNTVDDSCLKKIFFVVRKKSIKKKIKKIN